ncbi:hypothetical protein GB992_00900 [Lactobacillus rossiae]|uniref:Uncharacterized protein n=1 Tax=Furfurilactobacillus rossiae TaxID=231049 RepID=A0A7C9MYC7_9LACO|nr:hypothetical protein [Furfurilactobacillus milii]
MVNTILKEADLFCPNSVRINFTIYHSSKLKRKKIQSTVSKRGLNLFYFGLSRNYFLFVA